MKPSDKEKPSDKDKIENLNKKIEELEYEISLRSKINEILRDDLNRIKGKNKKFYQITFSGLDEKGKTRFKSTFLEVAFDKVSAIKQVRKTMFFPNSMIIESIEEFS